MKTMLRLLSLMASIVMLFSPEMPLSAQQSEYVYESVKNSYKTKEPLPFILGANYECSATLKESVVATTCYYRSKKYVWTSIHFRVKRCTDDSKSICIILENGLIQGFPPNSGQSSYDSNGKRTPRIIFPPDDLVFERVPSQSGKKVGIQFSAGTMKKKGDDTYHSAEFKTKELGRFRMVDNKPTTIRLTSRQGELEARYIFGGQRGSSRATSVKQEDREPGELTICSKSFPIPAAGTKVDRSTNFFAGRIISVYGEYVEVVRSDGTRCRSEGMTPLHINDRVITGKGRTRTRIELADERIEDPLKVTVINLGPNTVLEMMQLEKKFERVNESRVIHLIKGFIRNFSRNLGFGSKFSIRTGTSIMGIRGTDFTIEIDENTGAETFTLREGEIWVSPIKSNKTYKLKPGEKLVVNTSGEARRSLFNINNYNTYLQQKGIESSDSPSNGNDEYKVTEPEVLAASGFWKFGRVQSNVFLCDLTLTLVEGKYGNKIKGCHPNESFWELQGSTLVFKNSRGSVTTRFSLQREGRWEGQFLPNRSIRHYLTRGKPSKPSAEIKAGTAQSNSIGMEFVYIPGGSFMMGTDEDDIKKVLESYKNLKREGERKWFENEMPKRKVTIKNGFWMGKYEVTQKQWQAVMGSIPNDCYKNTYNPSNFSGDNHPVTCVGWNDAKEFIKRLNSTDSVYKYRLPSESEWEYAAKAETSTLKHWGDDLTSANSCKYANVYDASENIGGFFTTAPCTDGHKGTAPVGSFKPNGFGLYDMLGNVAEWVEDIYKENYVGLSNDGSPNLSTGKQTVHILRGGSWRGKIVRAADRSWGNASSNAFDDRGFRIVAELK